MELGGFRLFDEIAELITKDSCQLFIVLRIFMDMICVFGVCGHFK